MPREENEKFSFAFSEHAEELPSFLSSLQPEQSKVVQNRYYSSVGHQLECDRSLCVSLWFLLDIVEVPPFMKAHE